VHREDGKKAMKGNAKARSLLSLPGNKTTLPLIYMKQRDKVGGGEMGQAQLNITKESLDPTILDMILEALSFGVARSIINSAVEAMNQTNVTSRVNESLADSLTE
jgi:hypothetical protein